MANSSKDTIYVDIDDEITGVIDKVQNSPGKLVALVLPKRASVFQSIVNMKLLKRAADTGKKNVVLITAEAGLLPLAGAAGIHVAKTLNSKPEIPLAPSAIVDSDDEVDENTPLAGPGEDTPLDKAQPVGEFAGGAAAGAAASKLGDVETLNLDNSDPAADAAATDDKLKKPKKNKKLKVPNFNKFRLFLVIFLAIIVIAIILFFVLGSALGKATIKVSTNSTNVPVSLDLTLSTSASTVNSNSNTLPAQYVSSQKTFSQEVTTTGQKNEGQKASGTISVTAGSCHSSAQPSPIPAGTGASANSQTYIVEDQVSFACPGFGNNAQWTGYDSTNTNNTTSIPIVAQSGGSSFNVSGATFQIVGNSNYSATGSATGGTDNNVQVVNQNDITNAENKISTGNASSVKSSLDTQLKGQGYYPLDSTYNAGTPATTESANVGAVANSVTVTETVTYSMFGVYKSNLQKLMANSIDNQINTSKQSILDYGLGTANFTVNSQTTKTAQVALSTTAIAGVQLNTATIKSEVAGKKAGDIKSALSNNPNVTNVTVSFSPFWVSHAPSNTSKITVDIVKPTNK
jgi:hypothetical protein